MATSQNHIKFLLLSFLKSNYKLNQQTLRCKICSKLNFKLLFSFLSRWTYLNGCFLCGKVALKDLKHPDSDKISEARTIKLKNNIISLCKQRNDEWTGAIEQRISGCIDFVAREAVYHPRCCQKLHQYVFFLVLFYFSIFSDDQLYEQTINQEYYRAHIFLQKSQALGSTKGFGLL